ncbi:MAG: transposase [Patescibacteria group bacterium]|jgi:REP element-mobilizing transposase RayT
MPFKRSIRLKEYDYRSDGAYFVTICTDKKYKVINPAYKKIIKKELVDLVRRFTGVKIDYYVVMVNHCHIIFILKNSRVALPRVIQVFKSITTIKIKRLGFKGNFWQQNYYEHIIRNEKALNNIREYIRNNPEKERVEILNKSGEQARRLH